MTLILSGTDGVSDVDGSAATPAVRGADANTGIFFPAADTIAFAEGGVEVARITNTAAWSFGSSGTATGTSGQVLTSAGSAAAPAWTTPSAGGLTFISTLTPANGTSTASITSLSSYKSIIVITDGGVTLSTTSGLNFAISTNNGSTYSSATNFTNTNGSTPRGFLQIYRTDSSSSIKNGFTINPLDTAANVQMDTAVTGTVNAIRIGITAGATFTGTGNIFIYGMN
jgi:hypothetical protein